MSVYLHPSSFILHPLLMAQCAMCKTTAEAAGEASLSAGLNWGILVLLMPPVAIFSTLFWIVYKSQEPSRAKQND